MFTRNLVLFLGILAVIAFLFVAFKSFQGVFKSGAPKVEDANKTEVKEPAPKASPSVLKYNDALVLYKDKRIQLDGECRATPQNLTFKNGTKIMVDNRSAKIRSIKLGSTMSINPWSFKIVTLSSNTLPATWLLDCDGSQNVATVLIQK